jgi:hypothetical protein
VSMLLCGHMMQLEFVCLVLPKHVFLMVAMYCAYLNFSVLVICALNTLDIFHDELISL